MKDEITIHPDGTVNVPTWVTRGSMMMRRDSLEPDDPDQTYNFMKRYGLVPERYGIEHPVNKMFEDMSRGDLIDEIMQLRRQVNSGWLL